MMGAPPLQVGGIGSLVKSMMEKQEAKDHYSTAEHPTTSSMDSTSSQSSRGSNGHQHEMGAGASVASSTVNEPTTMAQPITRAQPAWRQRAMLREQHLATMLSRSLAVSRQASTPSQAVLLSNELVSQAQPDSMSDRPHFISSPSTSDVKFDTQRTRDSHQLSSNILQTTSSPTVTEAVPSDPILPLHPASSSPPSDFYSNRPSTSDTSGLTFSPETGDATSWRTCSDPAHDNTETVTSMSPPFSTGPWTTKKWSKHDDAEGRNVHTTCEDGEKKPKFFNNMLSAFNRKKKKNLPHELPYSSISFPSASTSSGRLTLKAGPSPKTSTKSSPAEGSKATPSPPSRPEARSGKIEQSENIGELCQLLNERRTRPGDEADADVTPKSAFDWDSDDEGDGSKVSMKNAFPRLKKHIKAAAGVSDAVEEMVPTTAEDVFRSFGMLSMDAGVGGSRANAFREHPELLGLGSDDFKEPTSIDNYARVMRSSSGQTADLVQGLAVPNRASVMKLFNDPIWSKDSVMGNDFQPHNQSKRESTILKASASMPSLALSPERNVPPTTFDHMGVTPGSYVRVSDPQDRRSRAFTYGSEQPTDQPPPMPPVSGAAEKAPMIKPPNARPSRPQLSVETTPPIPQRDIRRIISTPTYHPSVTTPLIDVSHTPKTPSRLRHGIGAYDSMGTNPYDPFFDHRQSSIKSNSPPFGNTTECTSDSTSPSSKKSPSRIPTPSWNKSPTTPRKAGKSKKNQKSPAFPNDVYAGGSPMVPMTGNRAMSATMPPPPSAPPNRPLPLTPSQTSMSPDDEISLPLSPEEKRLQRIKIGKDVVQRGSRLGLVPMKPIVDITEEDFEAVGLAAAAPKKEVNVAKKSNVLGSFFQRMRWSKQEVEEKQEEVKSQLGEHGPLKFLSGPKGSEVDSPAEEVKEHYEQALKLLKDVEGAKSSGGAQGKKTQIQGSGQPVGLGITAERFGEEEIRPLKQKWAIPRAGTISAEGNMTAQGEMKAMSTIAEADYGSPRPASSIYSTDDVEENWEDIDVRSAYSNKDAVPAPLNVKKQQYRRSTSRSSIPVLNVARSSKYLERGKAPAFSPRRDSSFRRKIKEESRLRQAKLGNHPALRGETQKKLDVDYGAQSRADAKVELARVDSAIGMRPDESQDGGYATKAVEQMQFVGQPISASIKSRVGSNSSQRVPEMGEGEKKERLSDDIDVQKLRSELGMDPVKLPLGTSAARHPNHPFTWDHEKIMCHTVHNKPTEQPPLPKGPKTYQVDLRDLSSKYFNPGSPGGGSSSSSSSSDPAKTNDITGVQKCSICGKICCRFADLLTAINNSVDSASQDLAESAERLKARNRVSLLRSAHPNGIEEYETFVECGQCGAKACTGCAGPCMESLCQMVYCVKCGKGVGCPVHDFF